MAQTSEVEQMGGESTGPLHGVTSRETLKNTFFLPPRKNGGKRAMAVLGPVEHCSPPENASLTIA